MTVSTWAVFGESKVGLSFLAVFRLHHPEIGVGERDLD
jgi:hypothetical protein